MIMAYGYGGYNFNFGNYGAPSIGGYNFGNLSLPNPTVNTGGVDFTSLNNLIGQAAGGYDPMAGIGGWTTDLSNSGQLGNLFTGQTFNPATGSYDPLGGIGTGLGGSGGVDWNSIASKINGLLGNASSIGGSGLGSGAGSSLLNSGLNLAGSIAPGLLALNYASGISSPDTSALQQVLGKSGNVDTSALQALLGRTTDTSRLQSVYDQIGTNAPGFVQAALDPMRQQIAAGYGDLTQSLAQRGVLGSSFGNADLSNYLSTTGRALSDAGASAYQTALGAQGGVAQQIAALQQGDTSQQANIAQAIPSLQNQNLGLQGNLAGQLAQLNSLAQQNKNNMYGRAFSLLGQGLSPNSGLLGGGTGSNLSAFTNALSTSLSDLFGG